MQFDTAQMDEIEKDVVRGFGRHRSRLCGQGLAASLAFDVTLALAGALVILPAPAFADGFRQEGFHFFKSIEVPAAAADATYGRVRIDEELLRHAGRDDVVPSVGGRVLPFFRRAVPAPPHSTGRTTPRVVFTGTESKTRIYTLELPASPPGTEYTSLELSREDTFEAGVSVWLGTKPDAWESIGYHSVFRYKGSGATRIRFRSGNRRYVRLEIQGGQAFSFPAAHYQPIRRVAEYRLELGVKDLRQTSDSDTRSSVLYLDNEGRRPIHRVVFRFAEPRFSRTLRVEAMRGGSRSYSEVMRSTINRSADQNADQVIDFTSAISGPLKFVIENGSDQPLQLKEMQAFSPLEELVFVLPEATQRSKMRLYYGNRFAGDLKFDARRTFDRKQPTVAVVLGPHTKNPDFAYAVTEPPLSSWLIRILFYLGLIGVVVPAYRVFSVYAGAADKS